MTPPQRIWGGQGTYAQAGNEFFARRTASQHAAHRIPHLRPHYRLLDVGCGPGSIAIELAQLLYNGSVVAIDLNAESITAARATAKEQGVLNIEFRQADAQDLCDLSSASFDVVHAHQTLIHIADKLAAMREMHRVLKEDGILSTRDWVQDARYPVIPALEKSVQMVLDIPRSKGMKPGFGLESQTVAKKAGFAWDRMETSSWAWEFSGEHRGIFARFGKGAMQSVFERSNVAEETVRASLEAWDEWAQTDGARSMAVDGALLCWK